MRKNLTAINYLLLVLAVILWLWTFAVWSLECSLEPANVGLTFLVSWLWAFRSNDSKRLLAGLILLGLISIPAWFVFLRSTICAEEPPPSIAVEFLLDTSDSMLVSVNGIPRYEAAIRAMDQIGTLPGLETSQVWRNLRVAGGGEGCNESELISSGANLSTEQFLEPLNRIRFGGTNAYEFGLDKIAEDLAPIVNNNDLRIAFLFLGDVNPAPCRAFDWVVRLRILRSMGIDATLCVFALDVALPEYNDFRERLLSEGFGCVHNVSNPDDISDIAVNVIEGQLLVLNEEVEILISPTPIVFVDLPTSTVNPSNTPTATDTPSSTPSPSDTPVEIPTNTSVSVDSITPTENVVQPTISSGATTVLAASQPCYVRASSESVAIRVGPGEARAIRGSLPSNLDFLVTGQTLDDGGDLWWRIEPTDGNTQETDRHWVSELDVEEFGDCNVISVVEASPILGGSAGGSTTLGENCPNNIATLLTPGGTARVIVPGIAGVSRRFDDYSQLVAGIKAGGIVEILDGPYCTTQSLVDGAYSVIWHIQVNPNNQPSNSLVYTNQDETAPLTSTVQGYLAEYTGFYDDNFNHSDIPYWGRNLSP